MKASYQPQKDQVFGYGCCSRFAIRLVCGIKIGQIKYNAKIHVVFGNISKAVVIFWNQF